MQQVDRAFVVTRWTGKPQVVGDGVLRRCKKPPALMRASNEICSARSLNVTPCSLGWVAVGVASRIRDHCDVGERRCSACECGNERFVTITTNAQLVGASSDIDLVQNSAQRLVCARLVTNTHQPCRSAVDIDCKKSLDFRTVGTVVNVDDVDSNILGATQNTGVVPWLKNELSRRGCVSA